MLKFSQVILVVLALGCDSPTAAPPMNVACGDGQHWCPEGTVCTPNSATCTSSVFWCQDRVHWCSGGLICTPDNAQCVDRLTWCGDGQHWCSGGFVCSRDNAHCVGPEVVIVPFPVQIQ